jgi:hypothetical protein
MDWRCDSSDRIPSLSSKLQSHKKETKLSTWCNEVHPIAQPRRGGSLALCDAVVLAVPLDDTILS